MSQLNWKTFLIAGSVLFLVGFLLGFIPQRQQASAARQEASQAASDLSRSRLALELAEIRDQAAMLYLEATRLNYGSALQHADRFFQQSERLAGQVEEPGLRASLQRLSERREQIRVQLAQGSAEVMDDLRPLMDTVQRDIRL